MLHKFLRHLYNSHLSVFVLINFEGLYLWAGEVLEFKALLIFHF